MSARLLSDPLPLRRALELPQYREDVILPWVYGRATLTPVALDATALEYLVADHPIVGVTAVEVGGLAISGWQLTQALDSTGHPIAKIRLTTAPKSGEAVAVSLIGRRHPQTGAVIEHPADIAEDLLRASGWAVDASAFEALRDAFPGLALGGVIAERMTVRAAVSALMDNLGAEWSASPLRAWLPDLMPDALSTLTPAGVDDASAESTHDAIATRLVVSFAQDWAAGSARASLTIEAPQSVETFGPIEADLSLPWVRTARDALAIASARLQRLARPLWTFTVTAAPGSDWRPGDALMLAHHWVPPGAAMITRITTTAERRTLTLARPAGPVPRVELARRGSLIDMAGADPLKITYRDGVATFTILTELGDPLAGASVSLDGAQTRSTDRRGQVQFATTRGAHTLLVVASGYEPFEMEVVV